ncbi:MAG: efflux RND transporter periplasmic adaptor subunit [Myxococcaceae bacterium]|nr:efflux RND transporter periplasmic adaptor subunit [Myxococcaceae bacterium]
MKAQLTIALLLVVAACKKPEDPAAAKPKETALPAVKVATAEVQHEKMPRFLTLTGSVMADKQSEVAANVAGRVATTYVERGMPVKASQVLAIVDSKAAGFQAAAANAQSQAAETQVSAAKQDCDRADTLFKQGAMAQAEYDRQKAACTAQLFQANAARANADLAGKLAGDTIIRAPIDGIVGERYVNVGEYVQPASKVASIFSIDPVRVSISVPERAVAQVSTGQTLNLTVTAYGERTFPATVKFVSPALRPGTRDLIIEASAANKDQALKPGMFATVLLETGEEEQPTVPLEAIKTEGTVKRMFLAREGQAYEMVVRTGVEKEGRVAVLEPLQAGSKVIVKPPPGLRDGSSILQ